jgi:hypothetical protein
MFNRVELIKALNPTLELMFDGFCQACPRLAIYRKVRKNSLSAQFSVERYIILIIKSSSSSNRFHHQIVFIIKSFSSSSRFHHQIVLIIKSFSSSSRFHQVVFIKSFSSSSSAHHEAVLIIKSYYQAIVAIQSIKSIYQVILSSHSTKSYYQATVACILWGLATIACYGRLCYGAQWSRSILVKVLITENLISTKSI